MSDTVKMTEKDARDRIGVFGVHQYRGWSGEHRLMHKVAAPYSLPPARSGDRSTKYLTARGARQLAASCEYVSIKNGGYTTFLTLTFDTPARQRLETIITSGMCTEVEYTKKGVSPKVTWLEPGERFTFSTVQKELSRFFDAIQKMYVRGWNYKDDLITHYVPGSGYMPCDPVEYDGVEPANIRRFSSAVMLKKVKFKPEKLQYLWVAENPASSVDLATGECKKNPHVHVLMRWTVPYCFFRAWAARIESIWRQGFANLQRLKSKKKESAAGYLMKALQYVAKATGASDQGEIKGNRYGISESARAPQWETLYTFAWASLGSLIERARMKQNRIRKPIEQERDELKQQLSQATDEKQKNAIQRAIERTREKLEKAKGRVYYGRNRVIMQGNEARDKVFQWFKNKGFEWFDKPLSMYTYFLEFRLKKEKERLEKMCKFWKESKWEANVVNWYEKMQKCDEYNIVLS